MSRFRRIRRNRKGVALLEVLIAGVILAIVLVGFLQGLNVTLLGTDRDSKMNSAQHMAQSQMEYIKSLTFNQSGYSTDILGVSQGYIVPQGYIIEVDCIDNYGNVTGKQLITVTVSYNSTNLASQDYRVVLKDYKIDR
jgi:Tfp pilus assembly protein PilV